MKVAVEKETLRGLRDDRNRLDFLSRLIQGGSDYVTFDELPEGVRLYTNRSSTAIFPDLRAAIDSAKLDDSFC